MTPSEKKNYVAALRPVLDRVRRDISAIKLPDGSRWTTEPLTFSNMERHVNGGPARGACPIKEGESVTMLGVLDMDSHKGQTDWAGMLAAAADVQASLALWGLQANAFRSSGGRGIHLIVMWEQPQDAFSVRQALATCIGMCGYTNGAKGVALHQIEIFPKQDEVGLGENGSQFILPLAEASEPLDLELGMALGRDAVLGMQWVMSDPVPVLQRPPRVQSTTEGTDTIAKVRGALFAIPNNEKVDYDAWFRLGCAVHEATGGSTDGLEIFQEWSDTAQHVEVDPKFAEERVWDYIKLNRGSGAVTRATLYQTAQKNGWGVSVIDDDGFDEVEVPAAEQAGVVEGDEPGAEMAEVEDHERPVYERDARTQQILPVLNNILKACRDPLECRWRIAHDRFRDEIMVARANTSQWRPFTDADYTRLAEYLEREFQPLGKERLRDAVHLVAHENSFDSAILWINSLPGSGGERIDRFLTTYMGVPDTPYARAVSRYMWTALAGRVLDPGCQADMAPVFIGDQGSGKTTAVKALAPSMDFYVEVGFHEKEDDLARKMRGRLVGEVAELTGFRKKEVEAMKAFMTRTYENWVPKFKEFGTTFPRRLLFIGTTNEERFLVDSTGNRRWLPIHVGQTDIEALRRDVLLLWAEARDMYTKVGIQWADAERLAREIHANHEVEDPWEERVANWLESGTLEENGGQKKVRDCTYLTTGMLLLDCMRIEPNRQTRSDQMRAASLLQKNGWVKDQFRVGGKMVRAYVPTLYQPTFDEVGTEIPF